MAEVVDGCLLGLDFLVGYECQVDLRIASSTLEGRNFLYPDPGYYQQSPELSGDHHQRCECSTLLRSYCLCSGGGSRRQ